MALIECHIGDTPHAYCKYPGTILGTGKFWSMANDRNYSQQTLTLTKSSKC